MKSCSVVLFVWGALLLGLVTTASVRRSGRPRFCYLTAERGSCKAHMPSWYYNCKTCMCELFIYGGCDGNRNRFSTERACREKCRAKCKGLDKCQIKCTSGYMKNHNGCPICRCVDPCENMKCSPWEECVVRRAPCPIVPCPLYGMCMLVCNLPKEIGFCYEYLPRWFFHQGHCKKFYYGGCGGNGNNFKTKAECKIKCQCPHLTCDEECEYGTESDKSGCPTCKCLGNPCAYTLCPIGYSCVPLKVIVPCTGMSCPPRAKCVKDNSYDVATKPGKCPRYRQHRNGRKCQSDAECLGKDKCCSVGPSYRCMDPV